MSALKLQIKRQNGGIRREMEGDRAGRPRDSGNKNRNGNGNASERRQREVSNCNIMRVGGLLFPDSLVTPLVLDACFFFSGYLFWLVGDQEPAIRQANKWNKKNYDQAREKQERGLEACLTSLMAQVPAGQAKLREPKMRKIKRWESYERGHGITSYSYYRTSSTIDCRRTKEQELFFYNSGLEVGCLRSRQVLMLHSFTNFYIDTASRHSKDLLVPAISW